MTFQLSYDLEIVYNNGNCLDNCMQTDFLFVSFSVDFRQIV